MLISLLLISSLFAVSCSGKKTVTKSDEVSPTVKPTSNPIETPTEKPTEQPTETPDIEVTPLVTDTPQSADSSKLYNKISDQIPAEYTTIRKDHCGTIQSISYKSHDYFGDNSEITKPAYVYLPYGYDETKQYNVLYMMHGIGGNEKEWGMFNDTSTVKIMMDNLIYNGDIEPFIIVAPNGRSSKDYAGESPDYNSFYQFGKELRNDLIPYIDANFATYAEYKDDGYDLTAARDHRAMCGLSMGGMQTINIGLCENLDIISYFGAFSACPTTNTSEKIVESIKKFPEYDIKNFYNICGTADDIALPSASAAVKDITTLTDRFKDGENYAWQKVNGGVHDFGVWYLGFYNNAQMIFK